MIYYTNNGYRMLMKQVSEYDSLWHHIHRFKSLQSDFTVHWHQFELSFINAGKAEISAQNQTPGFFHFYKGNIPQKWHTNTKSYQTVLYHNLYPSIDWLIEDYNGYTKHNFIVSEGGNPADITMSYKHTDGLEISKQGHLIVNTSVGRLIEEKPFAFQIILGDTVQVPCQYHLVQKGDAYEIGFQISPYNVKFDLIIDPILVFSTYSGSEGDNFGFTATYDSRSHLYAGGIVDGGNGTNGGPFPVTSGAFQTVYSGGVGQAPANLPCDIGINKYDSAGTTLLYSTYIGGSRDEYPHSLVADHEDNLLIMGTTYSPDFPVDTAAFDSSLNGSTDIFVFKMKPDGSDMLGSTYVGGSASDGLNTRSLRYNYSDDFRGDIVVDSVNNIYVASTTNSNDFPLKNAVQISRASTQDACIFSFDKSLRSLRFSTYLGGNNDDAMYSIRLFDTFVYVGGGTASNAMSFSVNGHKNSYQGGRADGFIAKFNLSGQLLNSTYFGTSTYDQIYFLDIDASGQIYAAGQTEGSLVRTPGTYGKDNTGQFIVRYAPNLSLINLSTTFGNRNLNPEIAPSAFLVDKCNNIYFSGWGSPINYDGLHSLTTKDLEVTPDAIQKTTDNNDFYLLVLSRDAFKLLFATYYGGNKTEDHVDGGTSRFDKKGVVYQSVCSSCPEPGNHYNDFPVSNSAPFKTNLSPRCSNASFKIDFQINFEVDAKFIANPTVGCAPLTVAFTNQSTKARQYFWDFGDGSPIDTSKNPVHIFQQSGIYQVKLSSIDSFSCNIAEFDSLIITVKESPRADFEYSSEKCSNEFLFKNKSVDYINPGWDFGDSSGIAFENDPSHRYYQDGTYQVLLKVKHPISNCEDTQTVLISLFGNPAQTIKIPNVFTPNSDQVNDCYTISGISPECDEAEIWIYNRWGVQVFHGKLPQDCWKGNVNNTGNGLPDGTYYYILSIQSKNPDIKSKQKIEGIIRIIR